MNSPDFAGLLAGLGTHPRHAKESPVTLGFSINRGTHTRGRALLDTRLRGMELVKRLKDAEGALGDETRFWAAQLAVLAVDMTWPAELVTHPPSSGKRVHHMATELAGYVAEGLGLPCRSLFVNPHPRGGRINVARRLGEDTPYTYAEPATGRRVLVVDDAYCTGMTAKRCVEAARPDQLRFVVLCRS